MIEQWHDFFIMVGGGAAALTGLVFVAISLNVHETLHDSTHRNRAIGTLSGFTIAFMICGFGLLGNQSEKFFGLEWLILSLVAGSIYLNGYIKARKGDSQTTLSICRTAIGTACHLFQAIGSVFIIMGNDVGFYIASIAMIIFFPLMISGAWLLVVGTHDSAGE